MSSNYLALALVGLIPGHDCELYASPLHSLVLTQRPGDGSTPDFFKHCNAVWCCAGCTRFPGEVIEMTDFQASLHGIQDQFRSQVAPAGLRTTVLHSIYPGLQ